VLVLVLVWVSWCWFFVKGKHCWLAGLGWLKPTSEQADKQIIRRENDKIFPIRLDDKPWLKVLLIDLW